jgi:4-hydroxy-3-polyprenylbenzoate decarboxylase
MKIVVAITGASGIIYAKRLVESLVQKEIKVYLLISENSVLTIQDELGVLIDLDNFVINELIDHPKDLVAYYHFKDLKAPIASGSNFFDGMVVVPCSGGTLGKIANGISDDLITRTAEVALKERRKLILVFRETPLNRIHIQNMLKLQDAGAIILPPSPGFYHKPKHLDDIINFVVAKILLQFGISTEITKYICYR